MLYQIQKKYLFLFFESMQQKKYKMKKKNELKLFQRVKNGREEFFVTKILEEKVFLREIFIDNVKLYFGKTLEINKSEII